ncbi:MAG: protein BatD [Candidatus Cloacimonetes bacterium]|nr:protein BatD [Candidatus Cloacimonadota bacterium]
MNHQSKFFLFLTLLITGSFLNAAVNIDAYVDKNRVGIQDNLRLTIEISGENLKDIATPRITSITDFRNLGSSSSTSESVSIINGKIERTKTISFTYTLKPLKTGKFLIPPLTISYENKNYSTKPISIIVVPGTTEKLPPPSLNNRQQQETTTEIEDNLFLETRISKNKVYKDEPITVDYLLFTRYDIANLSFGAEPNFSGFWKEDVFMPSNIAFTRTTRNGILYNQMLMRTIALFPNQTGILTIPSPEIIVDIRTQSRSFFDFGSTKRLTIDASPVTVMVQDLPEAGKPSNFSGAVGNFRINTTVSDTELKVGDSFTYTLELAGSGNLNHLTLPVLPEQRHLRFFDPEITTEINEDKISGKKIVKYLVVAQEQGSFTIEPLEFSFFDVKSGSYRTLYSKSYNLTVIEGDRNYIPSSTAQTLVQLENRDISFIIADSDLHDLILFFSLPGYWLLWILFTLTIPATVLLAREQVRLNENIDYQRQRKARSILKKYWKKATYYAREGKSEFYRAAQTGLTNYLADRLKLNRGSATEILLQRLRNSQLEQQIYSRIENFFDNCNKARFMPGGFSAENITTHYEHLKEIISDITKYGL